GDDLLRSYIIKRLATGVLLVFTVSVLVFSMLHLMPGDPVDLLVDRKVPAERREAIKVEYGLDRPLPEQYASWVKKIVTGMDFGISLRNRQPVWEMMKRRIPISLKLCGWTLLLEVLIAVPLGLLCAYKNEEEKSNGKAIICPCNDNGNGAWHHCRMRTEAGLR
ncbi:MAG TPA: ABC transporter permease, partial [Negativicutes bacterium]|nr:ABC transporter permease [Negativicutes bacterium]